jgi:hypothetical protein
MVDDRNDEQRQAHLTGSKYHAIHVATVRLPTVNLLQQIGARGVKTVSKPACRSDTQLNIQMHSLGGCALIYFGKDVYPRGFCGGKARSAHFFIPHFEQRRRFATSSSRASQPQSLPNVRGSEARSWPHAVHLSTNVY